MASTTTTAECQTVEEFQKLVRTLQRDWMQIKMEGLGQDEDAEEEEDKLVEDYMAAEQRKAGTQVELDQLNKELDQVAANKEGAINALREEVKNLAEITAAEAALERELSHTNPHVCFDALRQTCEEREGELQKLYKQIEEAEAEDQELKEKLRELQHRVPNAIPVIIKEKDEVLRTLDSAWRAEKRKLQLRFQELERQQRQLSWHLNRGSYIKQQPQDPRAQGQFGSKGEVEVVDDRLRIWETRLVKEHLEWKGASEDYKLQKIQTAAALEKARKDFEAKPAPGRRAAPGTRAYLDGHITTLKNQLAREEKLLKDLVNENSDLKRLKKETEDRIKELRKCNTQLLYSYQRQQQQVATVKGSEQRAIEGRPASSRTPMSAKRLRLEGR